MIGAAKSVGEPTAGYKQVTSVRCRSRGSVAAKHSDGGEYTLRHQELKRRVFNLLMAGNGWEPNRRAFGRGRTLEYTEADLVTRFMPNGEMDIGAVAQPPALFVAETSYDNRQGPAHIGTLTRIRSTGPGLDYQLEYTYDSDIPPITNAKLTELRNEQSRRHRVRRPISEYAFRRAYEVLSGQGYDCNQWLQRCIPPWLKESGHERNHLFNGCRVRDSGFDGPGAFRDLLPSIRRRSRRSSVGTAIGDAFERQETTQPNGNLSSLRKRGVRPLLAEAWHRTNNSRA